MRMMFHRRGAVYVAVLVTSMIVTMTTLAGLSLLSMQLDTNTGGTDALHARRHCDSAAAVVLANINADPNWRSKFKCGERSRTITLDGGEFWAVLENAAGDLQVVGDQSVHLTVQCAYGNATYACAMDLIPEFAPSEILNSSVYVGTHLKNLGVISTDGIVTVHESIKNGYDDIEAVAIIEEETGGEGLLAPVGSLLSVTNDVLAELLNTDDTTWMDEYKQLGTKIWYSSLSSGKIENVVISATRNPYGSTKNPHGIYYIECENRDVVLRNCRIEGTLVLFDVGDSSCIDEAIHWSVNSPGLPAVVVDGNFRLSLGRELLSESAVGLNFNPSIAPFRGESDNDTLDSYPTMIGAPVIIAGDLQIDTNMRTVIHGGLYVLGELDQRAPLSVYRDDLLTVFPPPGLRTVNMMTFGSGSYHSVPTVD